MKKIIFAILAIFLYGCTPKTEKSTDILSLNEYLNNKEVNIAEYIDDVYVVPLETTDESLIGSLKKVIITADNIVVFHNDTYATGIVIFDKQGRFVSNISIGEGPNDIIAPFDVNVDNAKNEILVAQGTGLIKRFDMNGKSNGEYKVPADYASFLISNQEFIFFALNTMNVGNDILEGKKIYATNRNLEIIDSDLPENNLPNYGGQLLKAAESAIVSQGLNDTIYSYSTKAGLSPRFILDYSDKHFDMTDVHDTYSMIIEQSKQNAFIYSGNYLETRDHSYMNLINMAEQRILHVFRNNNTGEIIAGSALLTGDSAMPLIQAPIATYGDYFVSTLEKFNVNGIVTSNMISKENAQVINQMKEEDNPILIFYKIK